MKITLLKKCLIFSLLLTFVGFTLNSKINKFSSDSIEGRVTTTSTTERKVQAISQTNSTSSAAAPYDPNNAIKLIKEISGIVFPKTDEISQIVSGCLKYFSDKPQDYQSLLSVFWTNMAKVSSKASKWQNSYIEDVIKNIAKKEVKVKKASRTCGDLKLLPTIDTAKILTLLQQATFFGGAQPNLKLVMIDGMYSAHRSNLDPGAFVKVNQASRIKAKEPKNKNMPKNVAAIFPKKKEANKLGQDKQKMLEAIGNGKAGNSTKPVPSKKVSAVPTTAPSSKA